MATLHEAMVDVLRDAGGGWMERDEIAREITRRDLFRRPSDGAHPPSDQLRLRARKPEYQHLFECSDARCTRIRLRPGLERQTSAPAPVDPPATRSQSTAKPSRAPSSAQEAHPWYEELREANRPRRLRILLIGESPPDPGAGERRFFYSPRLTHDNLYRGVAQAVYGETAAFGLSDKPRVLEQLRDDGFWLIDAVEQPINKATPASRRSALRAAVPHLVERCRELAPERGVVICHGAVYEVAAPALRAAGVRILHDRPLPFPLGNWRAQFVRGFRDALERPTAGG